MTDIPTPPPGSDPAGTVRTVGPPRLGGVLGRYELRQVLGHGAMATVFRARDTQLGREVAVKVMTLAIAARADSAERFRREAQAVAAVKHPGIVEIFDFVAATDTEPAYIVSELIAGPTLRRFLDERRGRVLPETAALLALPLAEALDAAHARGVIHRDIKPDNVMLDHAARDRVVLTDFGVAHVTGMETMTATGALVGSPSYMSPEQARGDAVGPHSDLFTFGVVLYEMATGHLPFAGRDALSILGAIARGTYKKPSLVSPFVGTAFDEICARCLKAAPADRYGSAGALAEDLRAYCAAAGIDPAAARQTIWKDADAFEASLRPHMADLAVAAARKHVRRGELAKGLAELSRATAYVPGHGEAERLMATISSRRRWALGAALMGGVALLGAGAWALAPRVTQWWADRGAAPAPTPARAPAFPAPAAAGAENEGGEPLSETASARPAGTQTGAAGPAGSLSVSTTSTVGTERRRRRRAALTESPGRTAGPSTPESQAGQRDGNPLPGMQGEARAGAPGAIGTTAAAAGEIPTSATPPPVEALPPADINQETEPNAATAAAVTPTTAPEAAKSLPNVPVEIYAERAFCYPSLDESRPRMTPARYTVKAGVHKIYCSPSGIEQRQLVSELTIGPPRGGGAFRIRLRRGDGGRPVVDARETSVLATPITTSP